MAFEPMEDRRISKKRHKPEEIVAKLRQVEILKEQERTVAEGIRWKMLLKVYITSGGWSIAV